jgi:hypothetical protein
MRGNARNVQRPRLVALLGMALLAAGYPLPTSAGEVLRSLAESDRNRDGSVDRREAERRALDVFSFADNDRDAYLTRDEYGSLVLVDSFVTADADRDGRVSVREFVALRMREFDAADTNHDGVLSQDEAR